MSDSGITKSRRGQMVFFSLLLVTIPAVAIAFPRLSFPIASAYVMSLAIRPIQAWYLGASPSRRFLYLLLVAVVAAALLYPFLLVTASLPKDFSELGRSLPRLEYLLRNRFMELRDFLYQSFRIRLDFDPADLLSRQLQTSGNDLVVAVPALMGSLLEWMVLTPVFLWFMLSAGSRVKTAFLNLVPNPWFERTYMLLHQFNGRFGDYIVAKAIEATILGGLVGMGLWIVGYPYAVLLAVVAGVTNILPYVGPLLGWLPALAVGALDSTGEANMLGMNIVFLLANLVDMTLVFPLLVSKIVNLHPLVVVGSVIVGSQAAGVAGMLLSIPAAVFLKLLLQQIHRSVYPEHA